MKRILPIFFLLLFVFCAPADPPCATTPCPESIKKIGECPDEGCTRTQGHTFDQELDKRKNISSVKHDEYKMTPPETRWCPRKVRAQEKNQLVRLIDRRDIMLFQQHPEEAIHSVETAA